jgi:PAS domain-containing protein
MHRSLAAKQEQVAARQFRKTHALRILRRAVDHCQELILLTDADGVLQYVNPSCEMVTGYSASELINQKVSCIGLANPKRRFLGFDVPTGVAKGSVSRHRRAALQAWPCG